MTHGSDDGSRKRTWLAAILATGGILVVVGLIVGAILGFATGAAIGAAVTETASDCHFEECVDSGILPGAAIGVVVGALVGGLAMAALWTYRVRKSREKRAEGDVQPRDPHAEDPVLR